MARSSVSRATPLVMIGTAMVRPPATLSSAEGTDRPLSQRLDCAHIRRNGFREGAREKRSDASIAAAEPSAPSRSLNLYSYSATIREDIGIHEDVRRERIA